MNSNEVCVYVYASGEVGLALVAQHKINQA